jgi:methyl coenzyme M reductase subunit C-like uncharacterized protein (methanogenesis marker protein 7)
MKKDQRSFKLVFMEEGEYYYMGRYISNSPGRAVKKAFTQLRKILKDEFQNKAILVLKESTRGSDQKTYVYEVKRVKKDKPVILTINGKKVKKEYDNVTKKLKVKINKELFGGSSILKELMKNKTLMKEVSKIPKEDIEKLLN